MSLKLDRLDRKILLALDTDARVSFSQIGKRVRASKNTVQYRVKRLLGNGVIKKFVTQYALGALGLFSGKIYVRIAGQSKETEREMYAWLVANKHIGWVARTEGRWDLMLAAMVEDLEHFNAIKEEFLKRYGSHVVSYDILFLVQAATSQRTYLLPDSRRSPPVQGFGVAKQVALDAGQLQLCRLIANNARYDYIDLARKLGFNIKTVQKRVRELESLGVVRGYVTFLDPKAIGYSFFKLCISLQNYQHRYRAFIQHCLDLPNVLHVIESLGPWEIELECETETLQQFYDLAHSIRNDFPDIIKHTEAVLISEELKLDFFPAWY
jgi:Lrp/AsnC family transcriptional regulator, leucine-responsive regulatory protein